MNAFAKTAAIAAAIAALSSAALAQEPVTDNAALMSNLHAAVDISGARTLDLVMAKAERQIGARLAKIDNTFNAPILFAQAPVSAEEDAPANARVTTLIVASN